MFIHVDSTDCTDPEKLKQTESGSLCNIVWGGDQIADKVLFRFIVCCPAVQLQRYNL